MYAHSEQPTTHLVKTVLYLCIINFNNKTPFWIVLKVILIRLFFENTLFLQLNALKSIVHLLKKLRIN